MMETTEELMALVPGKYRMQHPDYICASTHREFIQTCQAYMLDKRRTRWLTNIEPLAGSRGRVVWLTKTHARLPQWQDISNYLKITDAQVHEL